MGSRVLLVGWSGAGWDCLSRNLDRGRLPALAAIVERGTLIPLDSRGIYEPAAWWTTVATGCAPERHGIVLSLEPNPYSGQSEPAPGTSRRSRALWNIADASGRTAVVAGWPATHPAEQLRGAMVSDRFPDVLGLPGYRWPLQPASVFPEDWASDLAPLRVASNDLELQDIERFLPQAGARLADGDQAPGRFAAECARAASIHAAATACLERIDWDLAMIHYDLPQRAAVLLPQDRDVPARTLVWLDAMLGRLIEIAGPQTLVLFVASPAAHVSGCWLPFGQDPPEGLLCLSGPGSRADVWGLPATLYDVAPTALAALGLFDSGLAGTVRGDAWVGPLPEPLEASASEGGMHPAEPGAVAEGALLALDELRREGYAVAPDTTADAREGRRAYSLALMDLAEGRGGDGYARLRTAGRLQPGDPRPFLLIAFLSAVSSDAAEARRILKSFPEHHPFEAYVDWIEALLCLKEGRHGEARALTERSRAAGWGRGLLAALRGDLHCSARRWIDAMESYREALASGELYQHPALALAEVLLHLGQDREAATLAAEAVRRRYHSARGHFLLGIARIRLKQTVAARQSLETALRLDPRLTAARRWLARLDRTGGGAPC